MSEGAQKALGLLPMMQLFDKQIQVRMGQANVRRWSDDILRLLEEDEDRRPGSGGSAVLGDLALRESDLEVDGGPGLRVVVR